MCRNIVNELNFDNIEVVYTMINLFSESLDDKLELIKSNFKKLKQYPERLLTTLN